GFVRAKVTIGNPERTKVREIAFLTDSGSYYTVIPPSLAEELGIKPLARRKLRVADKREIGVDISVALVEVLGREVPIFVAIMDTPEPLLGAETLETLGLTIDLATGKLKPSRPYDADYLI
ncbi:MAG: Retroviral aspartyl protease, partial [Chloroflexi bacterium CG07_land_8_20_14_0_80_51_10]